MPRISTDNYDTVASWNGSQDLFVVEQPDGTKVATPAMVKQFIEAGNFTATGEIEDGHGNKLADVATVLAGKQDTLTFDNVPTQNSNNPVKSGGVKTYADSVLDALNTYRSGDWTARKYNDGAFECWRHFEKSVAANTIDTTTYLDFPSEIISVPECVTIGLIAGGADLYAAHIERKTSTSVRLAIINRHTAATTIGVDIHVYGRWK